MGVDAQGRLQVEVDGDVVVFAVGDVVHVRASECLTMSSPTRVLVTGAAGQVGLDLMDVLRGDTPLGGDPSFQPDGRKSWRGGV